MATNNFGSVYVFGPLIYHDNTYQWLIRGWKNMHLHVAVCGDKIKCVPNNLEKFGTY